LIAAHFKKLAGSIFTPFAQGMLLGHVVSSLSGRKSTFSKVIKGSRNSK
jgi:hypothetical protein